MTEGVWIYGVVPAGTTPPELRGVAGEPVRTLDVGDVVAVVGTVPLDEFGEDGLKKNLEDLDWIAGKARAHDAVLRQLGSPVVPLRLATVYRDDGSARSILQERGDDLAQSLEYVRNREEWGVKAFADTKALQQAAASRPQSGTDYLLRRKAALTAEKELIRRAAEIAREVHSDLVAKSVAGQTKQPQDRQLTGVAEPMVLNGTYLVDIERSGAFAEHVNALRDRVTGIRLQLTGPWPPYSFVSS